MIDKSEYVKLPLFVAFDIKPEAENGSYRSGELVCLGSEYHAVMINYINNIVVLLYLHYLED